MTSLRKDLIRLAHDNEGARVHLLPLLGQPKKAAAMSVKDGINQALGEMAKAMGEFLARKYPQSFAKMSKNPFSAGEFAQGVSGEIKNAKEPGRPGDIGVEAVWKVGMDRYPLIRVWARFPNPPGGKQIKGYERELAIKIAESPSSAVGRMGPAFTRDLDTWMSAANAAYQT